MVDFSLKCFCVSAYPEWLDPDMSMTKFRIILILIKLQRHDGMSHYWQLYHYIFHNGAGAKSFVHAQLN